MSLYARTLEIWEKGREHNSSGLCFTIHDLIQRDHPAWGEKNLYYGDGPINFPELWEQRTRKIYDVAGRWFNNREERIQALKNILNK